MYGMSDFDTFWAYEQYDELIAQCGWTKEEALADAKRTYAERVRAEEAELVLRHEEDLRAEKDEAAEAALEAFLAEERAQAAATNAEALERQGAAVSYETRETALDDAAERADAAREGWQQLFSKYEKAAPVLPPPDNPTKVAAALLDMFFPEKDGVRSIAQFGGKLHLWAGNRWAVLDEELLKTFFYKMTGNATYERMVRGNAIPTAWAPTEHSIKNLLAALKYHAIPDMQVISSRRKGIACANGFFDARLKKLVAASRDDYNTYASEIAYDSEATCPTWDKFLADVFGHAPEMKRTLQQWFGYVLSNDTSVQKILMLKGVPRSGKGTILRLLSALLGHSHIANPQLKMFASHFGLEGSIDKKLIAFSDTKWNVKGLETAIERMMLISGGDAVAIPRKHRSDYETTLQAKIMIISNTLPKFNDEGGPMHARTVPLTFVKSFTGHEDTYLTDRLLKELPGILRWAIDGYLSLRKQGSLHVSAASERALESMRSITQPIHSFIQDMCVVTPSGTSNLDELYRAFLSWCEDEGESTAGMPRQQFSQMLQDRLAMHVTSERRMKNGKYTTWYSGVKLISAA